MSTPDLSSVPTPKIVAWVTREGPGAFLAWVVAGILVVAAVMVGLRQLDPAAFAPAPTSIPVDIGNSLDSLPVSQLIPPSTEEDIGRAAVFQTARTDNSSFEAIDYTVVFGDSLFGISDKFEIEPETLLWANEEALSGNPDMLEPEMELVIPPVDGVYYQWQAGDTLESVAKAFEASEEEIINWPSNPISDLTNPDIPVGAYVMIPGGKGEFRQWVIPVLPSGAAGVSTTAYGPGGCSGSFSGAGGSGSFIWPSSMHTIVGNDFWDGHLALDIAAGDGLPVVAADSGVIVFAGWANGGYGYTVIVEHGNGYQTLYAHLYSVTARCGQSVSKGGTVGIGGSSGNSTGPHLHFEVRYNGGFLNPWTVLPAP